MEIRGQGALSVMSDCFRDLRARLRIRSSRRQTHRLVRSRNPFCRIPKSPRTKAQSAARFCDPKSYSSTPPRAPVASIVAPSCSHRKLGRFGRGRSSGVRAAFRRNDGVSAKWISAFAGMTTRWIVSTARAHDVIRSKSATTAKPDPRDEYAAWH